MKQTDEQRVAAFQRLADQRLDASYRLATAIMRDDGEAKDAVHDAVVLSWKRWSSLRDHRSSMPGSTASSSTSVAIV